MIRFRRPHVLAVGFFVLFGGSVSSRDVAAEGWFPALDQYEVRTWSVEDGLPQSSILAFAQTPDGFLWLGSQEGLVQFDGARFVHLGLSAGLPEANVESLAVDRDGDLWWTVLDRLYRRRGAEFEEVHRDGPPLMGPLLVVPRAAGGVWLARIDGPLSIVEPDGRVEEFRDAMGEGLQAIAVAEGRGRTCFLTDAVLCLREGRLHQLAAAGTLAPGGARARSLIIARDGTVWVGTLGEGLVGLREGNEENAVSLVRIGLERGLGEGEVFDLAEDRHGHLWFSDGTAGVARFDGEQVSRRETPRSVRSIFEDREGNLWMGTRSDGLVRFKAGPVSVFSSNRGLPAGSIHAVLETGDGSMWIGTEGGGLTELRDQGRPVIYDRGSGLPSLDVMSLAEDRAGRLLVGTAAGLGRLQDDRFVAMPTDGARQAFSVYEDRQGVVWAGFLDGVRRFETGRFREVPWGEASPIVAITETADGTMWFGGIDGLLRFRDGTVEHLAPDDGPSQTVLSLLADGDALWIGTYSGGLGRRSADGTFRQVGREHGLCDDDVYAILDDGAGQLWMSGNRGIFFVDRAEILAALDGDETSGSSPAIECRLLGDRDGLRRVEANGGNQPAGWRRDDGSLWFATTEGAVRVDPAAVLTTPRPPATRIEALSTRDRSYAVGSTELDLPPEQRELTIDFAAIYLSAPELVTFRYRLQGLDDDWTEIGTRRTVALAHQRPGTYTFEVGARIADGAWGASDRVTFTLRPRWHDTGLFRALLGTALLVALFAAHRLRLGRLQARRVELERLVALRTAELDGKRAELEQANETLESRVQEGIAALRQADRMAAYGHLVAGVAHELRHPIFALGTVAHLLAAKVASADSAEELALLERETARIRRLLDDLLELARPSGRDLVPIRVEPLLDEVVASYGTRRRDGERTWLPVETVVGGPLPRVSAEPERLVQLLLNLLDNACLHAEGASRVTLGASVGDTADGARRVVLRVGDDGPGISPALRSTLFEPFVSGRGGSGLGLAIAQTIAMSHGGELRVGTSPDGGAEFSVELPVGPVAPVVS